MRSESWLRLMSGLVLVGVFAMGTLFGAGLMRLQAPAVVGPAMPPPPPGMGGGPVEMMRRELALDATQDRQLQGIVDAHRGELDSIGRATQEKVRHVLFAIEDELRPHLSAEQVQRLETWRARRPPLPFGGPGMGPPGMGPRRGPPGSPPGMEPPPPPPPPPP